MHRTTRHFWDRFDRLPIAIQKTAKRNFNLMKENPSHPSLHFKKVGKLWSARIGIDHRALAIEDGGDTLWVWIGSHDDYDQLVKNRDI